MSIRKLAFPALAAAMALAVTACDRGDEGTYGQSDEATTQEDTSVAQDQGTANEPATTTQPGTSTADTTYGRDEPLPDESEPYAATGEQHGRRMGPEDGSDAGTGTDAGTATGTAGQDSGMTGEDTGMGSGESLADMPDFDEIDANSDGRISRDEAGAVTGLESHFEQIDANNDDHLSSDEYQQAKDEA
jgi:hypothetical protein